MKDKPLTTREAAWVEAYTGNGVEACRIAGYRGNDNVLAVQASKLLRKPNVAAALAKRQAQRSAARIATRVERQEFWTDVLKDSVVDMHNRLKASELLGRSEADFVEKHQVTGANGNPLFGVTPERLAQLAEDETGDA